MVAAFSENLKFFNKVAFVKVKRSSLFSIRLRTFCTSSGVIFSILSIYESVSMKGTYGEPERLELVFGCFNPQAS